MTINRLLAAALVLLLGVWALGIHSYLADTAHCAGTRNPALCELSIQAGDTVAVAVDAGNGIAR